MSLPLPGASANDPVNLQNHRMKSIALERHFLLTLCCCRQKVSRAKGILFEKSHGWRYALAHAFRLFKNKNHASRHRPWWFCLESLQARHSFYKVRRTLYLSGQLKLFHIYPVNMEQRKRVSRKRRSLPKFLTAQKDLFYGRQPRCRSKCVPPTSTQMASRAASACHLPLK